MLSFLNYISIILLFYCNNVFGIKFIKGTNELPQINELKPYKYKNYKRLITKLKNLNHTSIYQNKFKTVYYH